VKIYSGKSLWDIKAILIWCLIYNNIEFKIPLINMSLEAAPRCEISNLNLKELADLTSILNYKNIKIINDFPY